MGIIDGLNKIKDICLKIFDWSKKHKFIALILCLILVICFIKGIIWIYNDINYGRFVKVGEIESDGNFTFVQDEHNIYLFVRQNNQNNHLWKKVYDNLTYKISTNNNNLRKYSSKIAGSYIYPVAINKDDILLLNFNQNQIDWKITYSETTNILNTTKDKIENGPKFKYYKHPKIIQISHKIVLIFSDNSIFSYNIETKNFKKINNLELQIYNLHKLDEDTLLIIGKQKETIDIFKYSIKNNLITKIKILNAELKNNLHYLTNINCTLRVIWLNQKDFGVFAIDDHIERFLFSNFYRYENGEFLTIDKNTKHSQKTDISIDNPVVINENNILFFGGHKGIALFRRINQNCFLYTKNTNSFKNIGSLPQKMYNLIAIKTKNNKIYLVGTNKEYDSNTNNIYIYEFMQTKKTKILTEEKI